MSAHSLDIGGYSGHMATGPVDVPSCVFTWVRRPGEEPPVNLRGQIYRACPAINLSLLASADIQSVCLMENDCAVHLTYTRTVRETSQYVTTQQMMRILTLKKTGLIWKITSDVRMPQGAPVEHARFDQDRLTESEVQARILHERQCYRPGAGRFPLDNYERSVQGYTSNTGEPIGSPITESGYWR